MQRRRTSNNLHNHTNRGTMICGTFQWMVRSIRTVVFTYTIPSEPFPGDNWLDRLPHEGFPFGGKRYRNVYAAMVDSHPHPSRNLNCYINSIFIPPFMAESVVNYVGNLTWAHYVLSYGRNLLAGALVYFLTAGIFHYFCYVHSSTNKVFRLGGRKLPSRDIVWNQIRLATSSLFLYTMLPVVDDYLVEQDITRMYYTVEEIGGYMYYGLSMLCYFALVEIGIYWMHRTLHTNKFLYKHIHLLHHQYNKPETLTPWASIAFHPLDGILQASPYELFMFVVPCHYLTHLFLVFFTAVWATYIHDAMDFNVDPIMGSKYHTVHHTHYIYNYGQMFTFCDRFWGTLRIPLEPTGGVNKQVLKKVD